MIRIDNRVQVGSLKIGDMVTILPEGLLWEIEDTDDNTVTLMNDGKRKRLPVTKKVWPVQVN